MTIFIGAHRRSYFCLAAASLAFLSPICLFPKNVTFFFWGNDENQKNEYQKHLIWNFKPEDCQKINSWNLNNFHDFLKKIFWAKKKKKTCQINFFVKSINSLSKKLAKKKVETLTYFHAFPGSECIVVYKSDFFFYIELWFIFAILFWTYWGLLTQMHCFVVHFLKQFWWDQK